MTSESPAKDFFTKEIAQAYDANNSRLAPIADNMHFLIRLTLHDLPPEAKILCVGVGTGAEIFALAKIFPQFTFVGVEPSEAMLEVCQERVNSSGIANRCQFIHGYVQDVPPVETFDAALAILVGHFVKREERASFYQNMVSRLKKGGVLINTEISYDLNAPEFLTTLKHWERVQTLMGATSESLAKLPQTLREVLTVLPPTAVEDSLRRSGISTPVRFFQAFMISGWYGKKT